MKRFIAAGALGLLLISLLSGCKGRTMENMEPLNETVEVEIDTLSGFESVELQADTVAAPEDTESETTINHLQ